VTALPGPLRKVVQVHRNALAHVPFKIKPVPPFYAVLKFWSGLNREKSRSSENLGKP
jgi:hypothetical protein